MDRSDLVDIAHRACTLDELIETARLEARDDSIPASEDAKSLERWARAYAKGDRDALVRRLARPGVLRRRSRHEAERTRRLGLKSR